MPEVLDKALLRPGRFDRQVEVTLPTIFEREEIFRLYLEKINLDKSYNVDYYAKRLSTLTPGFTPSDIKNIVNESAIVAIRDGSEIVGDLHFEEAIERVIGGL